MGARCPPLPESESDWSLAWLRLKLLYCLGKKKLRIWLHQNKHPHRNTLNWDKISKHISHKAIQSLKITKQFTTRQFIHTLVHRWQANKHIIWPTACRSWAPWPEPLDEVTVNISLLESQSNNHRDTERPQKRCKTITKRQKRTTTRLKTTKHKATTIRGFKQRKVTTET